jgi:hypothetical protein
MKTSYEAIIDGDRLIWIGEAPDAGRRLRARVYVSPEQEALPPGVTGKDLADHIRKVVAETGGVTSIKDPVAWQREQRVDRPLPGREP